MTNLLSIENLEIVFHTPSGTVHAVNNVNFSLNSGEIIAIVGESGCGKSVTAHAIMGLIPSPPGQVTNGRILIEGQNVVAMTESQLERLRGNTVSMVFQDPMTSLNPVLTIGTQLRESFMTHQTRGKSDVHSKLLELLNIVGISAPESRLQQYPHQLSGGMRQRILIAMALACNPRILIADEPTTALDVTIQAQIIDLLKKINSQLATAIILISHDLGVIAGLCSRVIVMYAGMIVESADIDILFSHACHPYTRGLLNSVPRLDEKKNKLYSINGQPPSLLTLPTGCSFLPRCQYAMNICKSAPPLIIMDENHACRCWLVHPDSPYSPSDLYKEMQLG